MGEMHTGLKGKKRESLEARACELGKHDEELRE